MQRPSRSRSRERRGVAWGPFTSGSAVRPISFAIRRYLTRFAVPNSDIFRDSGACSSGFLGPPLAAHQCVTPLAIFSWLAKQDRIERELSATRLSLSQLQNKSSQPPVPIYSSTVCNTGIQYLSRFAERYLSRFAFRIFFPQKRLYMSVVTFHHVSADACSLLFT